MPPARDRSTPARRRVPALIVHGGAGADPNDAPDELREGVRAPGTGGWRVLAEGGRSLDAVEAAVRGLEDAPRFNAGHGAATSTGGVSGKRPGRVGDTPVIGAGTSADSSLGGVSCTGTGEAIMRVVLGRRALDVLKDADDPDYAAHVAVDLLVEKGRGEGGLILLDSKGRIGYAQSTPFMPVGWMAPSFHEPQVPF